MRNFLVVMATVGILASTADIGLGQGAAVPSLVGVWKGVSAVTTGAGASTNMQRLPQITIYSKGYYSVLAQDSQVPQPARQTPPPPVKTPGKPTDAEKIALYAFWAPVIANSGTYEVKGSTLIQRPTVSKGVPAVNTIEFRLEDGGKALVEIAKSAPGQPASETVRRYTRLE